MAVEHSPPVDVLDDDFPLRLTTGRRLESFNTGVQTGQVLLAAARGRRGAARLARGRRALRARRRRPRPRQLAPRRDRGAGRVRRDAAAGARVHEPALPRARRHERADDRRDRPALGNGGVQGDRDPGGRRLADLKLLDAPPSDAERAAIDAVRRRAARGERPPHRARRPRQPPPPPPRAPRRAAPRRLGQRGRARLRVAPALGAARRGVRRRDLLRAARARGAPGRRDARLHRSLVRARRARPSAPASIRARASASASARRRSTAPSPARRRSRSSSRPSRRRCRSGERACGCCAGSPTASTRRRSTRTVAAGGFEALARARELGPDAVIARGDRLEAARPRRRRVPDRRQVARGARPAGADALRRLQRRRVGAGHVQGPRADGERPVRARRGDHDRRLRDGRAEGLRLRPRRVPARARAVQHAIDASAAVTSTGFEIELRIGAGAYVCGEETALFQSIEGKRGEPRNKPPFPVEVGLFGKPTAVNNVETLFNVLEVLRVGGAAYAETGTEGSAGTRLFCVSGCVERPGLYELPFGATLRELLDLAGADTVKAVLLGGAAGAFVGPDHARPAAHARGHARRGRDARLRRRDRLRRRGRARAGACCGSRSSSATSRAASACRAASARCARRRR